jgi:hypothetical protein
MKDEIEFFIYSPFRMISTVPLVMVLVINRDSFSLKGMAASGTQTACWLLETAQLVRRKAVKPVRRSTVIVPVAGSSNRKRSATGTHEERFWVLASSTVPEFKEWVDAMPAAEAQGAWSMAQRTAKDER